MNKLVNIYQISSPLIISNLKKSGRTYKADDRQQHTVGNCKHKCDISVPEISHKSSSSVAKVLIQRFQILSILIQFGHS